MFQYYEPTMLPLYVLNYQEVSINEKCEAYAGLSSKSAPLDPERVRLDLVLQKTK